MILGVFIRYRVRFFVWFRVRRFRVVEEGLFVEVFVRRFLRFILFNFIWISIGRYFDFFLKIRR